MSASATLGERVIDGLRFGWRRKLPVVLQTEAAECGLASLTMVARYYGHDIDLAGLRRRASMSLKGANLARIIEIAGRLGFDSRPLRLELDELPRLKVPGILHLDLNHFVVLKQASAKGIVIHDPARGVQQLTLAEASKHFTGIALELTPAANFKPQRAREAISLRSLTGEVHGLKRALTQIFLLALGLEVVALMGPFYMQWVIDQVLVSADRSLLEQVSRSALSPQEVAMLVGGQVIAPLYRVMVRLNDQYVHAYGEPVALRPGMALSADIRIDRRRLIEWILEPLYGFGRRIMTQSATLKSGSEAASTRVRT